MDKYHIYEEIGKGEFSQVFKGREKKKIEYVAIKRIEKSVMSKIVNEVQIMHKLNSVHMMKFHDWYETRNNLWLILEYCTGADLDSLLEQDGHVPETTVRIFGLDMVAGLRYLHSMGLIHGDLRPRNFVVDEYGILKLSDFKFTQKIPKQPLGAKPVEERGTPAYMAPELFVPAGVPSFQSDFWALGCVLYQLRRGFVPFGDGADGSLTQLVNLINTKEPVHVPVPSAMGLKDHKQASEVPSISAELADLLLWLLEKEPHYRCDWGNMCNHPFWRPNNPVPPSQLPPQPLFESSVRAQELVRSQQVEAAARAEFGVTISDQEYQQLRQGAAGGTPVHTTPLKLPIAKLSATPASVSESSRSSRATEDPRPVNVRDKPTQPSAVSSLTQQRSSKPSSSVVQEGTPDHPSQARAPSQAHRTPHIKALQTGDGDKGVDSAVVSREFSMPLLMLQGSYIQVKPIVGNRAIETLEHASFQASSLPFETFDLEKVSQMSQTDLEVHLTQVYKALHKTFTAAQHPTGKNSSSGHVPSQPLMDLANITGYLTSLSASAEVANVVLNTHFLQLVLRLMKFEGAPPSSTAVLSPRQASSAVVAQNHSNLQAARTLAATALGLMLRYATYIQPPAIRNREEHVVPALVTLLGGGGQQGKMDLRLKRRAVAALGEITFYIAAQEEEEVAGDAAEKWVLPQAAIELLWRCLLEETDEVVRHYAAKTLENVLAQGGLEIRRNCISLDCAVRLLELSHSSQSSTSGANAGQKNESLPATCAVALSHMLVLVSTAHLPSSSAVGMRQTSWVDQSKQKKPSLSPQSKISSSLGEELFPTDGSKPGPVVGARFLAQLLGRASVSALMETLAEGPPKLQQAYLNLMNILFAAPLSNVQLSENGILAAIPESPSTTNTGTVSGNETALVTNRLNASRQSFVRSPSAVPTLFKLLERGATAAVRAKAMMALQHFCVFQPSLLPAVVTERRLPALLVKLLEPVYNQQELKPGQELSLFSKAAVSMTIYLRQGCADALSALSLELLTFEKSHLETVETAATQLKAMPTPPSNAGKRSMATPAPALPSPEESTRGFHSSPRSASDTGRNFAGAGFDSSRLRAAATQLQALMSVAGAQPSLRRLLLAVDGVLVDRLADTLVAFTRASTSCYGRMQTLASNSEDRETTGSGDEVLQLVEEACLVSLETISQVEVTVDELGPAVAESGVDLGTKLLQTLGLGRSDTRLQSEREGWTSFLLSFLVHLLPAMAGLLDLPRLDVRVVVAAALRLSLPGVIRCCEPMFSDPAAGNALRESLGLVVRKAGALLTDQLPIPQYTVRLLVDLLAQTSSSGSGAIGTIVGGLTQTGALETMVLLVKKCTGNHRGSEEEVGGGLDPQLIVLIRLLMERSVEAAQQLLKADLAEVLTSAFLVHVFTGLHKAMAPVEVGEESSPRQVLVLARSRQLDKVFVEEMLLLVDLLLAVLYCVFRQLAMNADHLSAEEKERHRQRQQTYLRLLGPLKGAVPGMLILLHCSTVLLERREDKGEEEEGLGKVDSSAVVHVQEVLSRCLGIVFDLFPDALVRQLLSLESLVAKAQQVLSLSDADTGTFVPRRILASCISSAQVNEKVKVRTLKILGGIGQMASTLNNGENVRDLICSNPLKGSLFQLCKTEQQRQLSQHDSEQTVMYKLATHVIHVGKSL